MSTTAPPTAALSRPPARPRGRRASSGVALALVGLLGVGGLAALGTGISAAAVPTFPDNVVVFPDRDFVTIEGYQDHIGETATVEVTRGGTVVGSAQGVVAEGDVAFEINHPGGVCWGNNTNLKVTPDIKAGDKVTIKFAGTGAGDTTVADAAVGPDHATLGSDGVTVTVKGHIDPALTQAQTEQRIVNPDLVPLVGRRDVRAVPGPLTPAPKGGYSSGLAFGAGGTFTATYIFDDPAAAKITANTGVERMMYWQVEDAAANRQGLTISEFGEFGGPGFGGCPVGPAQQDAPAGTFATVRSADKTKVTVSWTAATPVPDAAAVTGYEVQAITPATIAGTYSTVGMRLGVDATSTVLSVDPGVSNYSFEVRSLAGSKMSEPFRPSTTTPPPAPGDTTLPKLTLTPAPATDGSAVEATEVRLASETGADLYYTTDGSSVISGDSPSLTAKLYDPAKPIAITGTTATEVHAVAFDRAGNFVTTVGLYKPPAAQQPGSLLAPTGLAGAPGTAAGSIALTWNAAANATGYQVSVYNADGTTLIPAAQQPAETTKTTQTVAGLAGSTAYQFSVKAVNAGGSSPQSAKFRVATSEALVIGTAKWKLSDFRVTGTSSATSGTVTVHRAVRNATTGLLEPGAAITGLVNQPLTAAVPPATGSTFDARLRNGVPTTNPGQIFVKSSNGGVAGPFTVANG